MWVFGYGSLIWKQDFPVKRRLAGHVKGYLRRFWQGSTEHRGVPGNPGRVVTLIPATLEDKVWGVAFEIPEDSVDQVKRQLDHREQRYTAAHVTFCPVDQHEKNIELQLYIGTESGPNYLGPTSLDDIASQIYRSEGPSGRNIDYLLNLARSIRSMLPHVDDPHLFELERRVLEIQQKNEKQHDHD